MQPLPFTANIMDNGIINVPATITINAEKIETEKKIAIATTTKAWITAYSSSHDETDDTPFITAYMTNVREGIVATNMFPFGTKIQIPDLFGEKIFVVEDKMHRRKKNFIDIWMPSKEEAKKFGISFTQIVVLY